MKKILFSVVLGCVLLVSPLSVVIVRAEASYDAEDTNQLIANDEGYGNEDTEYYSSETENETVVEDAPETSTDEVINEEELTESNEEIIPTDDAPTDK